MVKLSVNGALVSFFAYTTTGVSKFQFDELKLMFEENHLENFDHPEELM